MMKKTIPFIIFMVVLMSASCSRYDVDEILLSRDDISLTFRKDLQMSYDPKTWQLGYNEARNEFRVNDDSMANYFVLRCDARPDTEGQEVTGYIEWTVRTNIKKYYNLKFEVKRISSDGKVWLWNKPQKIGVTVKFL